MYYIWTDGSSSLRTGTCGWAAIVCCKFDALTKNLGYELNPERHILCGHAEGTNQKAELLAVIHALKWTVPKSKSFIKTDSEYVINCVIKYRKDWERNNFITSSGTPVKNLELIKELWELCDNRKVHFKHVKGHAGHAGNEAADYVAGLVRRMGEGQYDAECVTQLVKEKLAYDRLIFK